MTDEQKELIAFMQHYYVQEIKRLQENNFHYISFVIIAQAIELLGTLLDNKPYRAQNQARKRFEIALLRLFDKKYAKANLKGWLYEHYRCNMSHRFTPSKYISFVKSTDVEQHLQFQEDGRMLLSAEHLAQDLAQAVERLKVRFERGLLKPKKTGLNFSELLS